jgi:hypothetical protein
VQSSRLAFLVSMGCRGETAGPRVHFLSSERWYRITLAHPSDGVIISCTVLEAQEAAWHLCLLHQLFIEVAKRGRRMLYLWKIATDFPSRRVAHFWPT